MRPGQNAEISPCFLLVHHRFEFTKRRIVSVVLSRWPETFELLVRGASLRDRSFPKVRSHSAMIARAGK
jgi:hypothetical protein